MAHQAPAPQPPSPGDPLGSAGPLMRAARWHARGDVRVDRIPVPEPGPGQVRVRVELCGICGSDVEEYRHGPVTVPVDRPNPLTGGGAPLTLGHEIVGVVESFGPGAGGGRLRVGDRVVPDVVLGCGSCYWCDRHQEGLCPNGAVIGQHTDGGLAEYVVAAERTCVPVPAGVPAEVAALAEPAAVAVRAVRKLPEPAGSCVLVLGAGTVGTLILQAARAAGAARLIAVDPSAERRSVALAAGADLAVAPEEATEAARAATDGRGADAVLECAGVPGAPAAAARLARRGGTVVLVGFRAADEPIPLLDVVLGELRLLGSAAHLWDEDVAAAVAMLSAGVLDAEALPRTVIPLDRLVADGFEAPPGGHKVLVRP
ncbi:alcohol dehydrogenase catalytic domain-containing protein [Streptomyces sp. 3MP-14]|uniref:2-deoxy-scyllo-inosamine dehydrogenase n=1 Tax=Streptomyces mimosae TaxID=2586635 RepID=A0A5N6A775_9ACTN|nr:MULTISPECIES: alcohol dehydrogenase catalytic domain-containing protein [Streptomyces]KAB8164634.1 alcohol dehydrogenase catalytic domain-containing protein [Streptomyces mimosae]KAB8175550.1 alcohol dehydrogenase catalytic domain-containing protein [Streptomyces sp. 3MP-14]